LRGLWHKEADFHHAATRSCRRRNQRDNNGPDMNIQVQGETLRISNLKELGSANSNDVRDRARAALTPSQKNIDIDLSEIKLLDSCGLGMLISLHKTTCSRQGSLRILNPTPGVLQILELTRLHRIFDIVKN
jgi:anti-sigma B factor antagonist